MKKGLIIISILLLAIFVTSCANQTADQGTLILKLTDKNYENYTKVLVTFSSIEVHKDSNWTNINLAEQTFNLIQLQDATALFGQQNLEVGKYTQIRLLVTKAEVELNNSEMKSVIIPSNEIKLVREFDIKENETTELIIDFDTTSIVKAGDKYNLKPVVQIITPKEFNEKLNQNNSEGILCTQDVKQCADESYVPRIPPNCDFRKCPGEE